MDKITQQLKRRFSSRGQSFSDELLSTLISRVIKDTPGLDIAALTRGEPAAQNALLAAIASPAEKSFTRTVTLEQSVASTGEINLLTQPKDGDWVAIDDGEVTKVFEFDEGTKASGTLGFSGQPADGNIFTLNDGSTTKVLEFDEGQEGQCANTCILRFTGIPADNSRLALFKANGHAVVFQFKRSGLADPGNKIVRCNVSTKEQAARELVQAINSVGNYAANRVNGFHASINDSNHAVVYVDRTQFGSGNATPILGQTQVEATTAVGTITQSGNLAVTVTGDGISGSPLAVAVAVVAGTKQKETATAAGTITDSGDLNVTVTGAGISGSPLTIPVAVIGGTAQVETATVVGTIDSDGEGDASVIVTAAGMTNSPKTVSVAVANDDTASDVGGKIRDALGIDADVSAFFDISGAGANVILTAKAKAANDATMNIAIDNDTCAGLTASPTSADTTAGVAADTAADWAAKVRTALGNTSAITALYDVGGTSTSIFLLAKAAAANDSTLNIALANGTCTGATDAATSSNTTSGVAPDNAAAWAAKVRTALGNESAVTDLYDVGGSSTQITLTRKTAQANDSTLNIALANGTAAGITPDSRSTNTRRGISGAGAAITIDQNFQGGQAEIIPGTGITAGRVGVAIGSSVAATRDNLIAAINGIANFGMEASVNNSSSAKVTAKTPGTAGNSMTLAKTGANLTVSGANLTGGQAAGDGGVQEGRIAVAIGGSANASATNLHTAINAESEDFSITSVNSPAGFCALSNTQAKGADGNRPISAEGDAIHFTGMSGGVDSAAIFITDEEVGPGRKVYLTGFQAVVRDDNWEDVTSVVITDSQSGTFATLPASILLVDDVVIPSSGGDLELSDLFLLGQGGSEGAGLRAYGIGNELTGGPLTITVSGTIKKA